MLLSIRLGLKFSNPLLENVDALSEVGVVLDPFDSMRILHVVHLVRPCMKSGEFLAKALRSMVLMVHLILESYDQNLVLCITSSDDSSACLVHQSRSPSDSVSCFGYCPDDVTVPTWSIYLEICTWFRSDSLLCMN